MHVRRAPRPTSDSVTYGRIPRSLWLPRNRRAFCLASDGGFCAESPPSPLRRPLFPPRRMLGSQGRSADTHISIASRQPPADPGWCTPGEGKYRGISRLRRDHKTSTRHKGEVVLPSPVLTLSLNRPLVLEGRPFSQALFVFSPTALGLEAAMASSPP
ncbi:hypothetical protein NDU88_001284 [Pleurodeles waltl]|uniref:Uncharacterized protein n=1 Tax=Pleurodeles waltl TaxID=8319 RepID=A0AAV7KSE1_PLEWA|nr:hypothetical protein NDU88_001284 [Pleurodeles waltl]